MFGRHLFLIAWVLLGALAGGTHAAEPIRVLFLGDESHHRPAAMYALLSPALKNSQIAATYTASVDDLTSAKLADVDVVLIFRDSGDLPAESEAALLAFVDQGKGLVAVHCASHCFRNSAKYTALVGGRFAHHGTGDFRAKIIDAQHPAMRDVGSFETWDETYVHNELAHDRRVLMVREQDGGYDPYTWVRSQGKGRVYYTALGHDERTWRNPAFLRLVTSAIGWTAGRRADEGPTVEYTDAGEGLPNYVAGQKWGTEADRQMRMPKPLGPEESLRQIHMPEGFRVEHVAAEPDVVKPIAMSFDERGRLWVAESVDYPNTLRDDPHQNGEDRIKICEDTDGDGRADRFTVFADRLNIPTSVLPIRGGAIVAVSPHLLLLLDKDGDDRADERKILFTGFGRKDTHAVVSNLHYGIDNWIYAVSGYSGGTIRVGEAEQSFKQCLFRFKPDGSAFEVLSSTSNNTWGLGLNEAGDIFASTANNEHSVFLGIPNRYFEAVRGWHGAGSAGIEDHKHYHPIAGDVRQMDWHGAFTAATGHEVYTARSFPSEYRNRAAFVCEPTGHLVHTDWLVPRGSGFVARDGYNLLASTDPWSAPIAAQVGPDGAVWVLDWYNYVVQHNPTPQGFTTGPGNAYETTLRDRQHGRVYRVVHQNAAAAPSLRLGVEDPGLLVQTLAHENMFWRLQAQRLLIERGKSDVVAQLQEIARSNSSSSAIPHAMWTLAGLHAQQADEQLAGICGAQLTHADPTVRRTALALLPRNARAVQPLLDSQVLKDPDAQVRLSALLTLAELPPDDRCAAAIAEVLASPTDQQDRWIPLAATSAAARNAEKFLSVVAAQSANAATALPSAPTRAVAEHYARGNPGAHIVSLLKDLSSAPPEQASAIVAGLAAGWPADAPPPIDQSVRDALAALLRRLPGSAGLPVIALANRWQAGDSIRAIAQELGAAFLAEAADSSRPEKERLASVAGLLGLDSEGRHAAQLVALIGPRSSPEFATAVLDALGASPAAKMGDAIIAGWTQYTPAAQTKAATVLLRRPEWTRALLTALADETIPGEQLSVEIEQRLTQHPDQKLRKQAIEVLARRGRLINADRQQVFDQVRPVLSRSGDATAGKAVFEKNCAKCHRHGGNGGNVGPDLTGMAARKPIDVLTDIIDPNRSVEGNFQQYTLSTSDGRILTGLLTAETRTTVELLDAEAHKQVVLREDIDELSASRRSIMPEGFEKLPAEELANLLAFLSARGRYFPLPLDKAATAISTVGMFIDRSGQAERLILSDWNPRTLCDIPFHFVDPRGDRVNNVILLYGPQGTFPPHMPKTVAVPCNAPAKVIHLLSGVSGWGYPLGKKGSLTMIVRLVYDDGQIEDHRLLNGEHFADYIRRVDVPGSKFATLAREQQLRYISIEPQRRDTAIAHIEFIKGDDATAPVVMAATVETVE